VSRERDAEYTEYVAARLSSLRRLAAALCGDWQRADDLVQATLTKLYVHWGRVRAATHPDA
jgi:DNA-directed RNA polymerase specialized sigma24 family protein